MRILIAGGVFRHSANDRQLRSPAPEETLAVGLIERGFDVVTTPLEPFLRISLSGGFDLVHVHHLSRAALATALSPLGRPVAFTEHAVPTALSWKLRLARKVVYRKSRAVVCLSERERVIKMTELHVPESKVWVIPNGVAASPDRASLRSWGGGPFRLMYVGQLIPLKQVNRAIAALVRLPNNVSLALAYHNRHLEAELRDLALVLGVEDRVSFLGALTPFELQREMKQAHALVLPSAHEALPSVVSEALVSGLPVVASDVGGVSEQLGNAGILISPDQSEDVAPAVFHLMKEFDMYARFASSRSEEMFEQYSVEAMVEGHIRMYASMLHDSQSHN